MYMTYQKGCNGRLKFFKKMIHLQTNATPQYIRELQNPGSEELCLAAKLRGLTKLQLPMQLMYTRILLYTMYA